MSEIKMIDFIVKCETQGCGNVGHEILLPAPETNTLFICGVCSIEIESVRRA